MNSTSVGLLSPTTTMWKQWNNCQISTVLTFMFYFERGFTFPLSVSGFFLHIIAMIVIRRVQKKSPVHVSHIIILMSLLVDDMIFAFTNSWRFGFRSILYQAIHGDAVFMVDMKETFPEIFWSCAVLNKVWHSFRNMIIALLAVERFIVVSYPLKARKICTSRNSTILITVCGFLALLRLQYAFGVGDIWIWTKNPCSGKWQFYNDNSDWWGKTFWFPTLGDYWLHLTTTLVPPVSISGAMSIGLLVSLSKSVKRREKLASTSMSGSQLEEQQKVIRSARSVLILSICFFILQMPQAIDRVVSMAHIITETKPSAAFNAFMTLSRNFADAMTALDIVIDFIAIILANRKYREELKSCLTFRY